ncbi:hypothetical protein ACFLYH_03105 [Candidatus Dependentiae bacterium]
MDEGKDDGAKNIWMKEKRLWRRILKARFFNHSINISKELFKGNFLTPFFALQFGLKDAGFFNLASHLAESIKAITKSTIIFSGNAMLARLKNSTLKVKQRAFKTIFQKINIIIFPLIIFIIINYSLIRKVQLITAASQTTIIMSLLFLLIALMEYFFTAYNQFYIIEEQSQRLFLFKILELVMYYIFIVSTNFTTPMTTLLGIIVLRILSLIIVAGNAYFIWRIKPSFYISYKLLITSTLVSIIFYFLLR